MFNFLLWCLLLVFCWPLALLALILYDGVLSLVSAIIFLPARLVRSV
jgi:hypothetical protein